MKKLFCLVLAACLMLSACGCGRFPLRSIREEKPFQWTLSADQVLLFETPEDCMEYLKKHVQDPFLSGQIGEDGSLTLTMTESQRQAILDFFRREIDRTLLEYNDGSKVRILVTEDCRELHVYGLTTRFPAYAYLEAVLNVKMFSFFCPEDYGEFMVYIHNADTRKVLVSGNLSGGNISWDEGDWADSYVLTAQEAEAYTRGKECRERAFFETLTPTIQESYIFLTAILPKMITKEYCYFYLDENYGFHLGLTPEQEEMTGKKLEGFIRNVEKNLEGRGSNLEISSDRRSCRISFAEEEAFRLDYYTVLTASCLLAQSLENPEGEPFVKVDIYQGDTYLGTADTEKGIPQGILPDVLESRSNR